MTFERQVAEKWRDEVPGARWFKADLQVHTIDDHPGGKVTMPADLAGGPAEPLTLTDYTRHFLQSAVDRRELAAPHCSDTYVLEMRMDDGAYRRIDELSGVLLSLLLETADDCPLVIDQPEDELNNQFLFDTVLPSLKKLRERSR